MSPKEEVLAILEDFEQGGWRLEHVNVVEQVVSLPGPEKVMTLYMTLPVEIAFRRPEKADV